MRDLRSWILALIEERERKPQLLLGDEEGFI
jgi:hypothetical protein